ncbi:MAG: hypothetical protein DCC49_04535 [Acidobacteria bacterium]|nr:MAG: hypothetical protein DCC49_04535 [Acidobacteriota bacterium]
MASWYDLRVFCTEGLGGNPLAVFTEPVEDMRATAAAIGYSETVFLGGEPSSRAGVRTARIFTPEGEIPFAGHPIVGAAWLFEELAGNPVNRLVVPYGEIEAWRVGDRAYLRSEPPEVGGASDDPFSVVEALRADPADLTPRLPIARCGHGARWTFVPFAEPQRVLELEPDFDMVKGVAEVGLYCFAMRGDEVTSRCFAPSVGIAEDPGTGSAALALMAYLARFSRRSPSELTVNQTECRIDVSMNERGIVIGGEVVLDGVRS